MHIVRLPDTHETGLASALATPAPSLWQRLRAWLRPQPAVAPRDIGLAGGLLVANSEALRRDLTDLGNRERLATAALSEAQQATRRVDMAGHDLAEQAEELAEAVRGCARHVAATAQLAARLAHSGFAASRAVVALEEKLAQTSEAVAALEDVFAQLRQARGANAQGAADTLAPDRIDTLSRRGAAALGSLCDDVRALAVEAGAAGRHCRAIAEVVAAHNDQGDVLSAAVQTQLRQAAGLIELAEAQRDGLGQLRRQVAVAAERQRCAGEAANDAAGRAQALPDEAQTLARFARGLVELPGGRD